MSEQNGNNHFTDLQHEALTKHFNMPLQFVNQDALVNA